MCIRDRDNIQIECHTFRCVDYVVDNYERLVDGRKITLLDLTVIFADIKKNQCKHDSTVVIVGEYKNTYEIISMEKHMMFPKYVNLKGLIENGTTRMEICEKCQKVMNVNPEDFSKFRGDA
eukprot:TRINITY_DN7431_c0_g1_i5.p2 TRINITY_DN7431_c0_g1~~TRINITY_DN7431_c0_g1_i5.p2  ORF type:complete len:121 (-),score=14.96 TRINITY_DN7431_c0_g1_i5:233-595(-)